MGRQRELYVRRRLIVPAEDGTSVLYPFGPFHGYLLPTKAHEEVAVRKMQQVLWVAAMSGGVAGFVALLSVGSLAVIATAVLVNLVIYRLMIDRLCRRLSRLPAGLSLRVLATSRANEPLSTLLIELLAGCTTVLIAAIITRNRSLIGCVAALGFAVPVWNLLLNAAGRQLSRAKVN